MLCVVCVWLMGLMCVLSVIEFEVVWHTCFVCVFCCVVVFVCAWVLNVCVLFEAHCVVLYLPGGVLLRVIVNVFVCLAVGFIV